MTSAGRTGTGACPFKASQDTSTSQLVTRGRGAHRRGGTSRLSLLFRLFGFMLFRLVLLSLMFLGRLRGLRRLIARRRGRRGIGRPGWRDDQGQQQQQDILLHVSSPITVKQTYMAWRL